ncbi:MAG: PilN domain-containing protein [Candidatus Competibacter sp.]|nr:PilN domain-containing protein [Candidatus Competibacter sp.]MDG4584074.1 PilN domain-containing protein [Candidatus Competibacter sp.]
MALSLSSSRLRVLTISPRWIWNAFWCWWRDGLLAWLPAGVRRWLTGSSRRLVIAVDADGCVLSREEVEQNQVLERLDWASLDDRTVAGWFRTEKARQLVLRFPADRALARTLSLPLAAEKNLRQVAGFEMDRLTPFSVDQVYYHARVLQRQPEQRRLRIGLTVLPRVAVEPILSRLRQQGLSPDVLDVMGAGGSDLNLLPPEQRVRRGLWGQRLRAMAIAVSLLLVAVASVLPIWQQRSLLLEAIAKSDRIHAAANQSLTLRDQLDRTLLTSRMLTEKKQATPARVDLLRELTLILPMDTWVERLQIKGDSLQINGQSAKASALVGIIEASDLLDGAGFLSPVTTDPRTNKERFLLGAHIGRGSQ